MAGRFTRNTALPPSSRAPRDRSKYVLRRAALGALLLLSWAADASEPRSAPTDRPAAASARSELPTVLSAGDAAAYGRIFALQEQGSWAAADELRAKLSDRRLIGHVLAQRYLHPQYHAGFQELADWLSAHADHPDAAGIYRLAERKRTKGSPRLTKPTGETLGGGWAINDLGPRPEPAMPPGRRLAGAEAARAGSLKASIRSRVRAGDLTGAERLIAGRDAAQLLSESEADFFKALVATAAFVRGDDARALELAREAAERSGRAVPRAHWIAGLALFKQKSFRDAAAHFEAIAKAPGADPWDVASGAFWASRAHARARRFEVVNHWLGVAAEQPRTFYGLLALRQLGLSSPFNWDMPEVTPRDVAELSRTPAGARALALIQVGQHARADAELRRVYATANPSQIRVLLGLAMRANLPGLSIRLAREISDFDGRRHDGAVYPIPPWTPEGGYVVDRALIFAFMRQESQFNPRAVSPAGARGLMQLMPQTAASMDGKSFRGRTHLLHDPVYNVTLGQRYIAHLLGHEAVQGDLIRLAAAYNGGPGNLSRWSRKHDHDEDDALLFIESLPSAETRHFITRILYSYWMYSERLGQPTPSLDAIAAGRWPTYIALDPDTKGPRRHAQNR